MNDFEKKLFRQPAYWISELIYDTLKSEIRLVLIANPETQKIEGTVYFSKIKNLDVTFFGDEDETIERYIPYLLGIMKTSEAEGMRYIITSDTTEITFISALEPIIHWENPAKPFQQWQKEQLK